MASVSCRQTCRRDFERIIFSFLFVYCWRSTVLLMLWPKAQPFTSTAILSSPSSLLSRNLSILSALHALVHAPLVWRNSKRHRGKVQKRSFCGVFICSSQDALPNTSPSAVTVILLTNLVFTRIIFRYWRITVDFRQLFVCRLAAFRQKNFVFCITQSTQGIIVHKFRALFFISFVWVFAALYPPLHSPYASV